MSTSSTSSFRAGVAARFALASIAVFIGVCAAFELVLYRLGDSWPYERVVAEQARTGAIYSQRYINATSGYKAIGVKEFSPKIVVLGNSRMLEFMEQSVPKGAGFYNAGVANSGGGELDSMMDILGSLDDGRLPETVVIGIDPLIFNPYSHDNARYSRPQRLWRRLTVRFPLLLRVWRRYTYYALLSDKSPWVRCLFSEAGAEGIGVDARLFQAGYARDGSYHYPDHYFPAPAPEGSAAPAQEATINESRYPPCAALDPALLEKFVSMLRYCRRRGIRVVGVLMPFRQDLYTALATLPTHRSFFQDFRARVPAIMAQMGFQCFDFSSPATVGLTNADFGDEIHLLEKPSSAIMKRILNLQGGPGSAKNELP